MKRWMLLALLAGCIKPQLQPCGDLVCPVDSVCLPNNTCASRDSIDVCVGKAEGETCTTTVFTGSCVAGVCTSPRCGDGVVSGSEQCDGPVSGVDCVDYGFDTGIPACSDRCGLDVVGSCVRFGWERVMTQAAWFLWTDGMRFAIATADRHRLELYENGQLTQSRQYDESLIVDSLEGRGSTIVASLYHRIVRSEAGGPFEDVNLTGLPDGNYVVQIADDGSLYALIINTSNAEIYHQSGGSWQQILNDTAAGSMIRWTNGALYVGYQSGAVRRYSGTGTTWTTSLFVLPSPVKDLYERGGVIYATTYNSGVYEVVNGTPNQIWDISYAHVLQIGADLYLAGDQTEIARRIGGLLEGIETPIYGDAVTDGTDLYVFANGVYRFKGIGLGKRAGLDQPATDAALFADGSVAVTSGTKALTPDGPNSWSERSPYSGTFAIAGSDDDLFYVSNGDDVQQWDGVMLTDVALPLGIPFIRDLAWRDDTSTLYAVGDQGLGMKRVGTTWTRFNDLSGCDLRAIALRVSDVYAAGNCGAEGVIWKLSGTTWSELHRTTVALSSLWVDASDNLYAAGLAGGITRIAGAWHDEPNAKGLSISATSPSDIWVGGGPDDVIHWDGTAWSRVRVVGAATPHVVATPRTVYIAGAASSVLVR